MPNATSSSRKWIVRAGLIAAVLVAATNRKHVFIDYDSGTVQSRRSILGITYSTADIETRFAKATIDGQRTALTGVPRWHNIASQAGRVDYQLSMFDPYLTLISPQEASTIKMNVLQILTNDDTRGVSKYLGQVKTDIARRERLREYYLRQNLIESDSHYMRE